MSQKDNINRIRAVYNALGDLKNSVVFVGGATVSLYATRQTEEARPTDDIDIVVEIFTRGEYLQLETQLREIGFQPDITSPSICRFTVQGIIVDVMRAAPHEEQQEEISVDVMATQNVLGFYNIWYPDGYTHSIQHQIDDRHTVRIFSSPYFIASKLEAFKGRGRNDGRLSHDFEDIVFVMENRRTLWEEIQAANEAVKHYLQNEFQTLLAKPFIEEWISSHVTDGSARVTDFIVENMQAIANS